MSFLAVEMEMAIQFSPGVVEIEAMAMVGKVVHSKTVLELWAQMRRGVVLGCRQE